MLKKLRIIKPCIIGVQFLSLWEFTHQLHIFEAACPIYHDLFQIVLAPEAVVTSFPETGSVMPGEWPSEEPRMIQAILGGHVRTV